MPSDRSVRRQLQTVFADIGVILERVERTGRERPYAGWYVHPSDDRGDDCRFCRAARSGHAVYVGYHSRQSIQTAAAYHAQHSRLGAEHHPDGGARR